MLQEKLQLQNHEDDKNQESRMDILFDEYGIPNSINLIVGKQHGTGISEPGTYDGEVLYIHVPAYMYLHTCTCIHVPAYMYF